MPKSVPATATAKQINEQHRLAVGCAENAIEHALMCGQMLVDKKASLDHGEFQAWVEKNCDFAYSTGARYMKAAQSTDAVNLSSLRHIFPSGKPKVKASAKPAQISPAGEICNKTAAEKAPFSTPDMPDNGPSQPTVPEPKPEGGVSTVILGMMEDDAEPECPEWDADEDAALEAASAEVMASAERALGTDAMTEIKRLNAEIAVLKLSRDGFMNGKSVMTNMLKTEQNKTARLEKEVAKLRQENETLRARLSMMDGETA